MASFGVVVLVAASCIATVTSYSTSLDMCGTPSNPTATSGYECTGALFTLVDINSFNTLKSEAGCVAGMLGLSTQLQGYHCMTFKNCPGAGCTCEVRQGCSSGNASAAATTKACLYGVQAASDCPVDVVAPEGSSHSSSARSLKGSAMMIFLLVLVSCVFHTEASYDTSLDMCGTPSNPIATSGHECTGALFTLVDINSFNTLKSEAGCVAGMLGLSTQLQGYHCMTFKNCPGAACTCEVRQGCSSGNASAAATTKACLYGVQATSDCPADVAAPAFSPTSSATSHKRSAFAIGSLLVATFAGALQAFK